MKSAVTASLAVFATGAIGGATGDGADHCGSRLADLRSHLASPDLPLAWRETTMDDGKPLLLALSEKEGQLVLRLVKTGEGLWAAGPASICNTGTEVQARLPAGQLQLGPAANWLLRQAMRDGAVFRLRLVDGVRLAVSTTGWSGEFAPAPAATR